MLLSALLAVGAYYTVSNFLDRRVSPNQNTQVEPTPTTTSTPTPEVYNNLLPSYRSQYNNPNILGRLEIPGINIDTLVARTVNNSYYLQYNLYNEYDQIGAPFFDYRNQDLPNNRQVNIYGHNTENESIYDKLPLISLEKYTDKNNFDKYKDIYLSLDSGKIHYEIIAVKILTDGNNEHMKLIFYSDEDFLNHANKMLSGSLYTKENLLISPTDRLIVIQICHYNPRDSYLLVIGKTTS